MERSGVDMLKAINPMFLVDFCADFAAAKQQPTSISTAVI
jgi:hypothetical protein